jgi:hypothetical protein
MALIYCSTKPLQVHCVVSLADPYGRNLGFLGRDYNILSVLNTRYKVEL